MFYETAQTIGPGWHKSYKPSHYEDMMWPPNSRRGRSPGSSPETYRRIINMDEEFPTRPKEQDDEFFSGRRSPTFPRRIFKEMWNDSPSNHRFAERPRLFKRVFKPAHWDEDFDRDVPHMRRTEKEFDREFEDRSMPRNFEDEFEKRFSARDLKKDIEEEFQKAEGRVHHIPIMVEKRMEEMKSRFGRDSPPERTHEEEYSEEWAGPQVSNLRKTFEPEDSLSSRFGHRRGRMENNDRQRAFTNPASTHSWDPHAVHTLPTRKAHKNSQSFDDSRHPVPPKSVFRSYSETHEDVSRPQQQHSAAFRSHSDGHCPKQTYVTRIEVNMPPQKDQESEARQDESAENEEKPPEQQDKELPKSKSKTKCDGSSLQQITAILQNVEDLVVRVETYSGTGRDKQYRFLDEMLTRCMLRLDDIDTDGREDVRTARKAAVREVQSCIDKLEAKAEEMERRSQAEKSDSGYLEDASETNDEENVSQTQRDSGESKEEDATVKEDESKTDDEQTKL